MVIGWLLLYSFGTYRALSIRRALAVRLYRSQALGIGLIASSVILLVFSEIIIATLSRPGGSGPFGEPIELPFSYFAVIVLFYWVDASVRAARRSDPLLRDTLHWGQLRIVVWVGIILLIVFNSLYVLYLMIDTGLPLDVAPNLPAILNFVSFMSYLSPIILGAIFLPLGALRSRDPTMRRHLGWFLLFVLLILVTSLVFLVLLIPVPSNLEALRYVAVEYGAALTYSIGGYFLYRSARALAPLNRLVVEETMMQPARVVQGTLVECEPGHTLRKLEQAFSAFRTRTRADSTGPAHSFWDKECSIASP